MILQAFAMKRETFHATKERCMMGNSDQQPAMTL